MDLEIRAADPDRVPDLAAVLGRAFASDPMMSWSFGLEDAERPVRRMFETVDPAFAREGWLWEIAAGSGVAMWVPPGGLARYHEIEEEHDGVVSALTQDAGERARALWGWIGDHLPDEPQWYLDHLAVDAAYRGHGVGSALVRWGLERSAADGVVATLETGNPANVAIYEHLGFRVGVEGDVPGDGPHIWVMRWDAHG